MKSNNRLKSTMLGALQYGFGSILYRSGVAGWHCIIHDFTMKQLQRASHKGHKKAQKLMSVLLAYRGVDVLDKRAGVALMAQQAENGDAQSQFLYAEALVKSQVILPDTESLAVRWYIAAAKQGNAMAALRLSKAYQTGELGLIQDSSEAEYWSQQFMQNSKNMSSES